MTTKGVGSDAETKNIHSIPIEDRIQSPWARPRTLITALFFIAVLLPMHMAQVVLWPMSLVPGGIRGGYWLWITHSKESFARLLVWISRDSTFVITSDDSINLEKVLRKEDGKVVGFDLDKRAVWISNHQMYADWTYMWAFYYLCDLTGAVVIVLKASLRHIPMAGLAMRFWDFIFLAGSWDKERGPTGKTLKTLGRRATKHKRNLALLLYPEGTLVSKLTRPRSAKYAEKANIPDMKHCLLPRSTGLLFCLRSLMPVTPDLSLFDVTMGYPGIPARGYAQSYYTLNSIYTARQAPPKVHLHLRWYNLKEVPVGTINPKLNPEEQDSALTAEERTVFDTWLRERWTEKDELLEYFYQNGEFPAKEGQRMEFKIQLKSIDDWLAVASNHVVLYLSYRAITRGVSYLSSRYM